MHAKPTTPRLAEFFQLIDDRNNCRGGSSEADPDRAAARRQDRRIDTDHLARHVEQGSTRIAFVDRRIGLKIIVVGTRLDVAVAGRDDARGDRAAKPKGVADGDHPIAHAHRFAVAEFHRLEWLVRLHPKHRDIDLFILANHFGLQFLAIGENDGYFIGVGDDVIVGNDKPGRIDDEAGAERIRFALVLFLILPLIAALLAALEELLEKIVEGRTRLQLRRILGALVVHGLRRRNIHDGIADSIREIGQGLRSLGAGRAGDGPDTASSAQDQRATKHEGGSRRGPPPPRVTSEAFHAAKFGE